VNQALLFFQDKKDEAEPREKRALMRLRGHDVMANNRRQTKSYLIVIYRTKERI
jgi:hypothetical protein